MNHLDWLIVTFLALSTFRAAAPMFSVTPQRLPWIIPAGGDALCERETFSRPFGPPLMRYLPSGEGQTVKFHKTKDRILNLPENPRGTLPASERAGDSA